MTPAAQKFYNLLLAHYLNDNTIISKVKKYLTDKTKEARKKTVFLVPTPTELDESIREHIDKLPDEDLSIAVKTFDMRMAPKTMPAKAKGGATFFDASVEDLPPYQQHIVKNFLKEVVPVHSIGKDLTHEEKENPKNFF